MVEGFLWIGKRALLGEPDGFFDGPGFLGVDLVPVVLGEDAPLHKGVAIGGDGIASAPVVLFLLRPVVAGEGLLALVVAVPAVGAGLDQGRAVPALALATARSVACRTAVTSLPSTRSPGMPIGVPRSTILPAVSFSVGVHSV